MMRLFLVIGFFFLLGTITLEAQVAETREGYDELYKKRIRKEYLNDIYIPSDFDDAFAEFKRLTDKEGLKKFKEADEDVVIKKLYFSLGRWVSVNWGFYGGSRLSHRLKKQYHVSHPEDQAVFLLRAFHRKLNGKDLGLREMAKQMRDNRLKARRARGGTVIKTEKRQRSKPKK